MSVFDLEEAKRMALESQKYPEHLVRVDPRLFRGTYPAFDGEVNGLKELWVSQNFFVRIFQHYEGLERISVHRSKLEDDKPMWKGDVTWDELQIIKHQCGRGNRRAFEIYPEDKNIIYGGNYRHLWVPANSMSFPDLLLKSNGIINVSEDPCTSEAILDGDWRN
jgi:hypothetical protein